MRPDPLDDQVAKALESKRLTGSQRGRMVWAALLPGGILFALLQTYGYARAGDLGLDSHAYWLAARDPSSWYTLPPLYTDAYLYSPVFAQVLAPLGLLPWPAFQSIWALMGLASLVWLLRPLGWFRGVVAGLFLVPDLLIGNIYVFFGLVLATSVRGAAGGLALPLLSKVTPGAVGLWHVARREWRSVAWAGAVTVGLVGVSYALAPDAWIRWLEFISTSAGTGGVGLLLRVLVALLVILWGARRSRAWVLAPAMVLACPVIEGYAVFAILAALPRLLEWQAHERSFRSEHVGRPASRARPDAVSRES